MAYIYRQTCSTCNGTKVDSDNQPCVDCNQTGYESIGEIPQLDDDIADIVDKINDCLSKLNDILEKLNEE